MAMLQCSYDFERSVWNIQLDFMLKANERDLENSKETVSVHTARDLYSTARRSIASSTSTRLAAFPDTRPRMKWRSGGRVDNRKQPFVEQLFHCRCF